MRAPGAYMPDMMNYAYDCDVYDVYAQMVTRTLPEKTFKQKYIVAYTGRREGIHYRYTHEELLELLGPSFLECTEVPDVLSQAMGNRVYLLRCLEQEDLLEKMRFVMEKKEI